MEALEKIVFGIIREIMASQSPDAVEKLSLVPPGVSPLMKGQWDPSAGEDGLVSLSPRHGGCYEG